MVSNPAPVGYSPFATSMGHFPSCPNPAPTGYSPFVPSMGHFPPQGIAGGHQLHLGLYGLSHISVNPTQNNIGCNPINPLHRMSAPFYAGNNIQYQGSNPMYQSIPINSLLRQGVPRQVNLLNTQQNQSTDNYSHLSRNHNSFYLILDISLVIHKLKIDILRNPIATRTVYSVYMYLVTQHSLLLISR